MTHERHGAIVAELPQPQTRHPEQVGCAKTADPVAVGSFGVPLPVVDLTGQVLDLGERQCTVFVVLSV